MSRELFRALPLVVALFVWAGCSGGGSGSTPQPQPSSAYGGQGTAPTFDQKANFTVVVPPVAALTTARQRRHVSSTRRAHDAVATTTNPYVSPKVESVAFQVFSVNGQPVRNAPTADVVNVSCGSSNGCSVPVQRVPAATGSNEFLVQTYAGPLGTGNLISSSSLVVAVPSTTSSSFGGTALTVGGLVASLSLATEIPGGTFHYNTAAAGAVAVNALDPAGAVIIGNTTLADAIAVSFPATIDNGVFAFPSGPSTSIVAPSHLAFTYNGSPIGAASVTASTTDFTGAAIATSIPIPVSPPATPPPPPPPVDVPLSLYAYDVTTNQMLEYAGILDLESGKPFSTTPRRVFDVAAPPNSPVVCGVNGPNIYSFAIRADASIVALTGCSDSNSQVAYVFNYPGSTSEVAPAGGGPTPPPPSSYYAIAPPNTSIFSEQTVRLDEANDRALFEFDGATLGNPEVVTESLANPGVPLSTFGATCLPVLGLSTCDLTGATPTSYSSPISGLAVDSQGYAYVSTTYPASYPGDPSGGAVTVVAYNETANNPQPIAQSQLTGITSDLGGANGLGTTISIEKNVLYSMAAFVSTLTDASGATIYPGLSGCPGPSFAAIPNGTSSNCLGGGGTNLYLSAYKGTTSPLTGPINQTSTTPASFMFGGDTIGGFGSGLNTFADFMTVKDGFVYVINDTNGLVIDVYNGNVATGYTTETPPFATLQFPNVNTNDVISIAVGPTGSGTGGPTLLSRPAHVNRNIKAWLAERQRRLRMAARKR